MQSVSKKYHTLDVHREVNSDFWNTPNF